MKNLINDGTIIRLRPINIHPQPMCNIASLILEERTKKLPIRQAIPPIPKPTPEAKNPITPTIKPITSPIQIGNVLAKKTAFKIVLLEEDYFFGSSFLQEETISGSSITILSFLIPVVLRTISSIEPTLCNKFR